MLHLFDLQLFSEEPDSQGEPNGQSEPNGESGEKDPKPEELSGKPAAKYTDDDLDRIINQKFAAWQKQQEKKISEAERLGQMTEAEKAAERMKVLEDKIHSYEVAAAKGEMTKQARAILQDANIHASDEIISNLVAEDAETTKAAVENFAALFNDAVEKAVKEKLKSEPPKSGSRSSGLTKAQIMAIPNTKERQRAIAENLELFQK